MSKRNQERAGGGESEVMVRRTDRRACMDWKGMWEVGPLRASRGEQK